MAWRLLRLAQFAVVAARAWRTHHHQQARRGYGRSSLIMMPEGPECKSLAESLDLQLGGSRYILDDVSFAAGRYSYEGSEPKDTDKLRELILSEPARTTSPQTLQHVKSKGKFIWFDFGAVTLWSTLGLTGGWTFNAEKRHVRLSLAFRPADASAAESSRGEKQRRLYFYDMRNFGTLRVSLDRTELEAKLEDLGHDWLDPASRPTIEQFLALAAKAARYKRPLAVFLMDQKKTSGIGNYVLSEVLWKTRIHPQAQCADITQEGWADIYAAIAATLEESYASQSPLLSSTSAYRQFRFDVYAQKVSPAGTPVVRVEGPHKRTIHHCPLAQTRFQPAEQ